MAQEKNLKQQNQPQSGLASDIIVQADHKFYDHIIYKSKNKEFMRQCCNVLNKELLFFNNGDYAAFKVTLNEHDTIFKNKNITVFKENKKENKKAQGFRGPDISANELLQRLARAAKIVNAIDLIYFHAQLDKTKNPEMQILTDLFKSINVNYIHYVENPEDILSKLNESIQQLENRKHFMGELNYLTIKRLLEINWRDRALTDEVLEKMIKDIHSKPAKPLKTPKEYIDSSASSVNLFGVAEKWASKASKLFSANTVEDYTPVQTVFLASRQKYTDGKMTKETLEGIQLANSYINELYYLHLANEPELKYFDGNTVTCFDHYLEGCDNNPESLFYTLNRTLYPITKNYPVFDDEKKNLALLKIFLLTQLNIKIDYSSQVKNITGLADLVVKIEAISTFSEVEQLKNAGFEIAPSSYAGVYYEKLAFKASDSDNELSQRFVRATKIVNVIDLIYFHAQLDKIQTSEMQILTNLFKSVDKNRILYDKKPEDILSKLNASIQQLEKRKHFMGEHNYLKIKRLLEINWGDRSLTDDELERMIKNIHSKPSQPFSANTVENDTPVQTVYLASRQKYTDGEMSKETLEGIQLANSYINELHYSYLANVPELVDCKGYTATRFEAYLESCNNNPEYFLHYLNINLSPIIKNYPVFEDEKKNLALLKILLLTQLNTKSDSSSHASTHRLVDRVNEIAALSVLSEVEQLKNAGFEIDPSSHAGVYYDKLSLLACSPDTKPLSKAGILPTHSVLLLAQQPEKILLGENTANLYQEQNRQLNTTADPQPNLYTEERPQFSQ